MNRLIMNTMYLNQLRRYLQLKSNACVAGDDSSKPDLNTTYSFHQF